MLQTKNKSIETIYFTKILSMGPLSPQTQSHHALPWQVGVGGDWKCRYNFFLWCTHDIEVFWRWLQLLQPAAPHSKGGRPYCSSAVTQDIYEGGSSIHTPISNICIRYSPIHITTMYMIVTPSGISRRWQQNNLVGAHTVCRAVL